MSLSDHLQKARTQRLIEAGVLPSEFALKPEPEIQEPEPVEEVPQGLFAPITIEALPTGLFLVADSTIELTELPEGELGATCPHCNGFGRLDMVDLVGHTMHHTCDTCGTMWQVRQQVDETVLP
jgi:hypothetical protein